MNTMRSKTLSPEWRSFSFQGMPEIADYASFHKFKKDQVIFYSGHLPYGLFILTSGEVEIKYDNNKTETILAPALLGISAFKKKIPFSGTLKAISPCEIFFISYSVYKEMKSTTNPIEKWIRKYI